MAGDRSLRIPSSLTDFVDEEQKPNREGENVKRKTKLIVLIFFNLIFISVLLIIRFAHPDKPKFVLQDATVFAFNLSPTPGPPNFLNSSLQITLAFKNPNQISGIFYTDLGIYAEYKNQQITYETTIPRAYQGHQETTVWSLFINGVNVPISPYNVPALTGDQSNGVINLTVKLDGHVRWKIGSLITRKYHINVVCDAVMDFGGKFTNSGGGGVFVASSAKYLLYRRCTVAV